MVEEFRQRKMVGLERAIPAPVEVARLNIARAFYGGTYRRNRNLICCVNIEEYMVSGSIVGSDYYIYYT